MAKRILVLAVLALANCTQAFITNSADSKRLKILIGQVMVQNPCTTNKASLESYLILKYGSEKKLLEMWFSHQRHPKTLVPEGDIKLIGEWLEHEYLD
jgi:hypothetical protein